MTRTAIVISSFLALAVAQSLGKTSREVHPKIKTWRCSTKGGCKEQTNAIVLDAASHPIHQANNTALGCGNWGSGPDPAVCPDVESCYKNCVMEGISDYSTYGVKTAGDRLTLDMYGKNGVSSPRVYMLAGNEKSYEMMHLTGKEFTYDVDVSKLPCGMNGALYLSEMEEKGGQGPLNPGGAAYGTGYCDAQCYVTPWINGLVS